MEDITAPVTGTAPAGSRAFEVIAAGGLLVTLGQSVDSLRSVVSAIRAWLRRGGQTRRTVRLELGGDVLELSEATEADQDRLVGLFLSRHAAGKSG